MRNPDYKILSVLLTPAEMDELRSYCKDNHISMTAYARFCIKAGYLRGFEFADVVIDSSDSPVLVPVKGT